MAIKLIALDLDGTTLNSQKKLTEKTRDALIRAAESGVEIIPVTGRCYHSLPEELMELGSHHYIRYAITSNGAEIRDIKNGEILYDDYINESGTREIKQILDKNSWMVEVYVKGRAFIERADYERILKGEAEYRSRDYVLKTRIPVKGVKQLLDVHRGKVEKVAVYFPSTSIVQNIKDEFENVTSAELTASGRNNLEFVALGCNKAGTLKIMCGILGIKFSEVLAFGDSYNDLEMLKISGVSVAMENAEDIVKENADYITGQNDCDGVANLINGRLLRNNWNI